MVGTSVAFCIEDIVKKNSSFNVDDVKAIYPDKNFDSIEEMLSFNKKYFWQGIEDEAEKVFYDLYAAGKIRQPKSLKYGKKLLAWPVPKWFKSYDEFRARQMRHGNQHFIELLEAEGLHQL